MKIENADMRGGLSFGKLLAAFTVGALVGTWYEEVLHFVVEGYYENRSGVVHGPFNPLYGIGYVLMLLALRPIRRPYAAVLIGAVLGGGFEYLANAAQEQLTGGVSWDYHDRLLNINGRTTLPYALFWGLLGFFMVHVVFPHLERAYEALPKRASSWTALGLSAFFLVNMTLSYTALLRQSERREGLEPRTPYGEFLDRNYPCERLEAAFPDIVYEEAEE